MQESTSATASGGRKRISGVSEHAGAPPGARGLRLGGMPTVSVIVASHHERPALDACLAVLRPSCREAGIELVVARASAAAEILDLQEQYPDVLFMPAPDGCTTPMLRGFGLAAAEGDIVVITDDSRLPGSSWLRDTMSLTVPTPSE